MTRTRLEMETVMEKLEECGRPSLTDIARRASAASAHPRMSRIATGL